MGPWTRLAPSACPPTRVDLRDFVNKPHFLCSPLDMVCIFCKFCKFPIYEGPASPRHCTEKHKIQNSYKKEKMSCTKCQKKVKKSKKFKKVSCKFSKIASQSGPRERSITLL